MVVWLRPLWWCLRAGSTLIVFVCWICAPVPAGYNSAQCSQQKTIAVCLCHCSLWLHIHILRYTNTHITRYMSCWWDCYVTKSTEQTWGQVLFSHFIKHWTTLENLQNFSWRKVKICCHCARVYEDILTLYIKIDDIHKFENCHAKQSQSVL